MGPVRCLSSCLTTRLMLFRNVQGGEANWTSDNEIRIQNRTIYYGKVVTTEIASAILCLTAVIEAIAYTSLMVASLFILPCTSRPFEFFASYAKSSWFTVYWNLGNVVVFNLGYYNLITHESFARFSIDHSERGDLLKSILKLIHVALTCFALLAICFTGRGIQLPHNLFDFLDKEYTRTEDTLFIHDWAWPIQDRVPEGRVQLLQEFGGKTIASLVNGYIFFKGQILNKISAGSRERVKEADPEVFLFVLTRTVYIFTFGSLKGKTPIFFNTSTQNAITELREEDAKEASSLEQYLSDHVQFANAPQNPVLNKLKAIAYGEMRGIFVKRCWSMACRNNQNSS